MSSRVPKVRKLARDCPIPTKVEFEIWCLIQAIDETWLQAGLSREVNPVTGQIGYWKHLRSGDLLVVEVES